MSQPTEVDPTQTKVECAPNSTLANANNVTPVTTTEATVEFDTDMVALSDAESNDSVGPNDSEDEQDTSAVVDMLSEDDEEETAQVDPNGLRTKHEIANPTIPEPPFPQVPEGMATKLLGTVSSVVDSTVVVESDINTAQQLYQHQQVLDQGCPLALENGDVVGVLFETFGPVYRPLFSICFSNAQSVAAKQVAVGVKIFYLPDHAKAVSLAALSKFKGSDASNIYDEEVAENEMEFSDDEEETRRRAQLRQKNRRPAKKPTGTHPPRHTLGSNPGGYSISNPFTATPTAGYTSGPANPFMDQGVQPAPSQGRGQVVSYDDLCPAPHVTSAPPTRPADPYRSADAPQPQPQQPPSQTANPDQSSNSYMSFLLSMVPGFSSRNPSSNS
ncbi:hypothetical protein IWQ61_000606 [Dispira simplex]|nr:hypothetical protein IWQ61_000606 [Dispira simplex]